MDRLFQASSFYLPTSTKNSTSLANVPNSIAGGEYTQQQAGGSEAASTNTLSSHRPVPQTKDDRWNTRFQQLKDYKKKNGNCNVPGTCKKGNILGRWVVKQRQLFQNGELKHERFQQLDELGFRWDTRQIKKPESTARQDILFREMVGRVKQYVEKYSNGHPCYIPFRCKEDPKLGTFANHRRSEWRNDKLSKEKIDALLEAGFKFEHSNVSKSNSNNTQSTQASINDNMINNNDDDDDDECDNTAMNSNDSSSSTSFATLSTTPNIDAGTTLRSESTNDAAAVVVDNDNSNNNVTTAAGGVDTSSSRAQQRLATEKNNDVAADDSINNVQQQSQQQLQQQQQLATQKNNNVTTGDSVNDAQKQSQLHHQQPGHQVREGSQKEPTDSDDDDAADTDDAQQEVPDETFSTRIIPIHRSWWARHVREVQRPLREKREKEEQERFQDLNRKGKIAVKLEQEEEDVDDDDEDVDNCII